MLTLPMTPVSVRLPICWLKTLKSRAYSEKTGVSEVIRAALEEYAEKHDINLVGF